MINKKTHLIAINAYGDIELTFQRACHTRGPSLPSLVSTFISSSNICLQLFDSCKAYCTTTTTPRILFLFLSFILICSTLLTMATRKATHAGSWYTADGMLLLALLFSFSSIPHFSTLCECYNVVQEGSWLNSFLSG